MCYMFNYLLIQIKKILHIIFTYNIYMYKIFHIITYIGLIHVEDLKNQLVN